MGGRTALLFTLLLLSGQAWLSQGVPLVQQRRLGPQHEARGEHTAGLALPDAQQLPQPAPDEQPPPPPPRRWWQRLWPWGRPDPPRAVHVLPVWPDGRAASPVELVLPESHVQRELRPGPPLDPHPPPPGGGPSDEPRPAGFGGDGLYTYNSSAMMPLIPWSLSWMSDMEQMRNRSQGSGGFDIDVARTLSTFAAISYCNASNLLPWNCSRCGGPTGGFTTQDVVFDRQWNLLAYAGFSAPLNAIVVAFRGTDSRSLYNWVENMRTWRTDMHINYPDAPPGALVHGGFFYSYNSSALAQNITRAVQALHDKHPGVPVYAVGHSLGGAMATICALDIRLNLGIEDVRLYTYGSPRVGNYVFAEWFRQYVKIRWRFTHNRDMVPSVPIQLMGFRHVAQEVWLLELDASHTLVGLCDESGEDPLCHNSMCYLGLCSSIGDHLLYLSEMYAPRPMGC